MSAMEMDVLDSTGHTKHIWDVDKPGEVDAARELYNTLIKKGYKAFYVEENGKEGKKMDSFAPKAGMMIMMIPPVVGG